jgi:HTH-type transcriptional regulator / antitoxin HigA
MSNLLTTFTPDWISPPGETIEELMREKGWSELDLAQSLRYSKQNIGLLINGQALITEEVALNLEKVLGGSANFWLSRKIQYRTEN